MKSFFFSGLLLLNTLVLWAQPSQADKEAAFFALETLSIPSETVLEVGGMDFLPDGRLAVCTRRGEVWLVDGLYGEKPPVFKRFAQGLHEPLGLTVQGNSLLIAQRGELSRLTDTDGDDIADKFETIYRWPLSANYHEYAYGPELTPDGGMLISLNVGWEGRGVSQVKWRGWILKVFSDGRMEPFACGMRSPAGTYLTPSGDLFYSENQGDWVGSGRITHIEQGDFAGHPASLRWATETTSPVKVRTEDIVEKDYGTLYKAAEQVEGIKPPAIWLPHGIMGISTADMLVDTTEGKFGPFAGDMIVSDQGQSKLMRVQLEKVNGTYQGAVFPFREGWASGLLRLSFGKDGTLFGGMTSRGWASTGPAPFALQRLSWTGKTPFEMKAIHVQDDGLELTFTEPIDPATAAQLSHYAVQGFTYQYHQTYGSPAIDLLECPVRSAKVSSDGLRVKLVIDGLRVGYVHEVKLQKLRSQSGQDLLHDVAYYTLNQLPGGMAMTGGMAMHDVATTPLATSGKYQPAAPASWNGKIDQEIVLSTVAGLQYDQKELRAAAGSRVKLTLHNPDDMQHNFVLIRPGTLDAVAKQALSLGLAGPGKHYIPETDAVLYHTTLLSPETEETIYFQVPDQAGEYLFVCTVPGHATVMNGIFRVTPRAK